MERWPIDLKYYNPPKQWTGRIDGVAENVLRWHQSIAYLDLSSQETPINLPTNAIAILGFACDEGVRRNKGRVGAVSGPKNIREACCNLPLHHMDTKLFDLGDINCIDGDLQTAQETLGNAVAGVLKSGAKTLLFGGGHEIVYAHYLGIRKAFPDQKIGVINFDAHFDLREVGENGPSSGTGFWQIAQNGELNYLAIGIQKHSNTQKLFEAAKEHEVQTILYQYFCEKNEDNIIETIERFASTVDQLYLTIDLDVFAAAYAPGVSSPASIGIVPDHFFLRIINAIYKLPQLIAIDIAECNPLYDQDERTAKLAALLAFQYL